MAGKQALEFASTAIKGETKRDDKEVEIKLEGQITCHKQGIRGNATQIKLTAPGQPLEFPDLRSAGFKPGDDVEIVVQRRPLTDFDVVAAYEKPPK